MSANRKTGHAESESSQLIDALGTFVRSVAAAELDALGQKVEDLDVELSRRIADLDERADSTLGALKRELQTGLESVRGTAASAESALGQLERDLRPRMEALDRLVGDLDERLAKRIREATKAEQELRSNVDALGERLTASASELGERMRGVIEQVQAAREAAQREIAVEREARQALGQRMQSVAESVTAAQQQVQQQLETAQRLSTVLNTLTSVFATQRAVQPSAGDDGANPTAQRSPGSAAAVGTISDASLADLDSALNKLFPR